MSFPHSTVINYILVPCFYVHNCKREIKHKKIRLQVIRMNKKRRIDTEVIYTHIYIIFIRNVNMHILHNWYLLDACMLSHFNCVLLLLTLWIDSTDHGIL